MPTDLQQNQIAGYLQPYIRAAERHAGGFGSLLWASEKTQRIRFRTISQAVDLNDKSVLDAGCGRGDFLGYLLSKNVRPAEYVGLEAVEALVREAQSRKYPACRIIRADFVQDAARLFIGADTIVFSGSLNTLSTADFYSTLSRAFDAATEAVVFNFLCSTALAGQSYLIWHPLQQVMEFVARFGCTLRVFSDYLPGDCTIAMLKES